MSESEPCIQSQLSEHLRNALTLTLRIRPSNPFAFLSEYFLNAHHRSEPIFQAYAFATSTHWTASGLEERLGLSYETLVHPSSPGYTAGIRLKDFFALTTLFCRGYEPIQLALGKVCSTVIDSDERISFTTFYNLILIHLITQGISQLLLKHADLMDRLRETFASQFPQKTISREKYQSLLTQLIPAHALDELKAKSVAIKMNNALDLEKIKSIQTEGSWLNMNDVVEAISQRLTLL